MFESKSAAKLRIILHICKFLEFFLQKFFFYAEYYIYKVYILFVNQKSGRKDRKRRPYGLGMV